MVLSVDHWVNEVVLRERWAMTKSAISPQRINFCQPFHILDREDITEQLKENMWTPNSKIEIAKGL
jgi:hypothetical protein